MKKETPRKDLCCQTTHPCPWVASLVKTRQQWPHREQGLIHTIFESQGNKLVFSGKHQMTLLCWLAQSQPSKCKDSRLIYASFSSGLRGQWCIRPLWLPHALTEIQNKELTAFCLPSAISHVWPKQRASLSCCDLRLHASRAVYEQGQHFREEGSSEVKILSFVSLLTILIDPKHEKCMWCNSWLHLTDIYWLTSSWNISIVKSMDRSLAHCTSTCWLGQKHWLIFRALK